jgi:hypothetical protein
LWARRCRWAGGCQKGYTRRRGAEPCCAMRFVPAALPGRRPRSRPMSGSRWRPLPIQPMPGCRLAPAADNKAQLANTVGSVEEMRDV